MSTELETAAEASAGGWLRWRRAQADISPGTPCANCETPLIGTYCHGCGQLAEDFHKSVWKLGREALESFFHLDGRLARTVPRLLWRPGRLTRDYVDGKRAFQVPPLRMFLVVLLLTFVVGQWAIGRQGADVLAEQAGSFGTDISDGVNGRENAQVALDQARAEIQADETLTEAERRIAEATLNRNWGGLAAGITAAQEANRTVQTEATNPADRQAATDLEGWLEQRLKAVQAEPRRFALLLGVWAQRVALLALPVSALILTGLFFWRRDVFVFDHLIFSMHSLTFQLLLITTILLLALVVGAAAWWLAWLAPVHLFVHMREAYRSGVVATLMRMFVLFTATSVALGFMLMLWLFLAFNAMSGG